MNSQTGFCGSFYQFSLCTVCLDHEKCQDSFSSWRSSAHRCCRSFPQPSRANDKELTQIPVVNTKEKWEKKTRRRISHIKKGRRKKKDMVVANVAVVAAAVAVLAATIRKVAVIQKTRQNNTKRKRTNEQLPWPWSILLCS
ncbi:hypothetical protein PHET_05534 [Paragonimus heterotremus]|uniref:Uncharacterized protein n=1 Tax=Paragonimus heterotremus TaxID=100268 RepID=A0A8J4WRG1_9TREM|nr:hypothetical protein PHET_05534 [Paragonimus heterotremus]